MAARTFNPMLTRRATPTAVRPPVRPAPAKRTMGTATGVPRFAAKSTATPAISQRNDRWEGEAQRVAEKAKRPAAPRPLTSMVAAKTAPVAAKPAPLAARASVSTSSPSPASPARARISASAAGRTLRASPPRTRVGVRAPRVDRTGTPSTGPPGKLKLTPTPALSDVGSTGEPLSSALQHRLEAVLGADLSVVRIHTGPAAQHAAETVNARAFTVGTHIYLNAGESADDLVLIAHEMAHAVQQSATLHAADPRGPPQSSEGAITLTAAPLGMIQRTEGDGDKGLLDYAGDAVNAAKGAVVQGFWYAVDTFAPQAIIDLLHEVRDVGFLGMLKKRITSALDFVFSALKNQGGTMAKIATFFEGLLEKAKPIFAALAAGNCEPLIKAVKDLGDMLGKMAGDAWDKITTFLKPVGDWLENVWKKFGAPVVDFLKEYAAQQWEWIQNLGKTLWDLTQPVRDFYSGAWTEIKKLLGFNQGGDDDGSGGLIGWIKTTAGEVWDGIKTELKPIIEPIQQTATAIADFLPLSQILNLREKINEWLDKATAMADNMDQPDDVAENQDLLRDIILPGIKRAIVTLRGKVTAASNWTTEKIGGLVGKATSFITSLSGHALLSPFQGALAWLSEEATAIGTWASDKVAGLFGYVDQALVALDTWLEPILATLKKLFAALGNLMSFLGDLVLGPLLLVPACIRDPIKDFIVTRILSQIPVFSQLVQLPDIWAKIQPAFRAIIVQVFRDGNLFGAAWTFFKTVLGLLGVPPQLVTNLIRNAAKAIKDVLKDPVGFLGNVLTAMKLGLLQFVDRIDKHLLDGAVNWLLGGVKGPGIKIPDPFAITLRNVLDLVLQVLDLTKEKIFQRIEKKKGKETADKVRKIVAAGEKIFEWVSVLYHEGPAGLWKHIKEDLGNLWGKLLDMVIDYLIGKIVQQATIWVTKTLASGGLSVILDAIKAVYDALQVIAQYLQQMLEVANSVCEGIIDIAKGVLDKAANMVESAAARLIPMVLAFLARTLGIGDLPVVIGEGVQKVRTTVEGAIDNLIDKTFGAIDWAKQKGKEALNKLKEWWEAREEFTTDSGEPHAIQIDGEDAAAKVVVHSDLVGLDQAVDRVEKHDGAPKTQKTKARSLHGKITSTITEMKGVPVGTRDKSDPNFAKLKKLNSAIRGFFREIIPIFAKYLFDSATDLPEAPITKFVQSGDKASSAEITELSTKRKIGAIPGSASPRGWSAIVAGGLTERSPNYVRMHLINENFSGGNENKNLVPGPTQHNNLHRHGIEDPLKILIGAAPNLPGYKGVVWMSAKVVYHTTDGGAWSQTIKDTGVKATDFAQSISVSWGMHEKKAKTWEKQGVSGSYHLGPMPVPPFLAKDAPALRKALQAA